MLPKGHIEPGEDMRHTAVREVREETGVWARVKDDLGQISFKLSGRQVNIQFFWMEKMVDEDNPAIEPYDPDVYFAEGQYSGRDAEDSFDHFEEQREMNVEYLQGLPDSVVDRVGMHGKIGEISVAHVMNEWAFHDIGHIKQIGEIIRALKYYPEMGAFRAQYKVNP